MDNKIVCSNFFFLDAKNSNDLVVDSNWVYTPGGSQKK